MKKIKIIMVDDNVQYRRNLRNYLESNLNCEILGEASNGKEFLKLSKIGLADIILMDIEMEQMDGLKASKLALWNFSYLKIIAITMHSEKVYLRQLVESGFKGCVLKSDIYTQLFLAIEKVLRGELFMPGNIQFDS